MKIYTRTGDDGTTGLLGGPRVSKAHPRIDAYGEVDELNAWLGAVRSELGDADLQQLVTRVQHELFAVGAELATPPGSTASVPCLQREAVERLEQSIDAFEGELPPLREFILPGGSRSAAWFHVARTTCRRAERRVVQLTTDQPEAVSAHLITYLNRLSDLLFVLARTVNHREGAGDTPWDKDAV